jgi:MiaB-like tRNA modifying enzyme
MKKVFVEGFGCSLNLADTGVVRYFFQKNNCVLTNNPGEADIAIINTCAVKEKTEFRMLTFLKKIKSQIPKESRLLVYGCLAAINPERIKKEVPSAVIVKPGLSALAQALGFDEEEYSPSLKMIHSNPLISIIPVARGCLSNCSFCAVKRVWGNLRSYSVEEIVNRINRDLESGAKEFWLTGQDVGCYGFDIQTDLAELLKEIIKIPKKFKVRVGMASPQHIIRIKKKLLPLFNNPKIYQFIHIPIQSGSNSILYSMRRPYAVEKVIDLVNDCRKIIPNVTISTDIIVGFPGETEEDFQQTVNVAKTCKFGMLNLSKYGDRKGTRSETMADKISGLEKKRRGKRFSKVYKKYMLDFHEKLVLQEHKVLFTERGKHPDTSIGRLPNYVPVVVSENLAGKWARVQVTRPFTNYVEGQVLEMISPGDFFSIEQRKTATSF